jgi:flavodoxin
MSKIFIYYSLTGNGDIVANYLKKQKVSIRKVNIKDKMPKSFVGRIIVGGYLAGISAKAKLLDFDSDIKKYDEVIIGSPIWNGRLTPAINSVLDLLDLKNKKITFILCSGSGSAPKAESYLKSKYKKMQIINLKEPKNNIEILKSINL